MGKSFPGCRQARRPGLIHPRRAAVGDLKESNRAGIGPIDSPAGKGYPDIMQDMPQVRMVRERPPESGGPAEYLRRAEALITEMDRLNPWPRPRGFVQRFRTHEDYEAWKKQQSNPRLW